MKRKILFRGISVDTGKWVYGGFHTDGERCVIIHKQCNNLSHHTEVRPETVSQFIGLKDKNKIDIFENDVVNGGSYNGKYDYGIVVYWKDMFVLEPIGKFVEGVSDIYNEITHLEVIGNVFENLDLLKR